MAKKRKDWRTKFLLVFALVLGALFTSSAVLLCLGMLPTIVAYFVDRSKEKLKPLTVGAMNFSGCFPFLMELWTSGDNTMSAGMDAFSDPRSIVVMYMAALIGYLIDWSVSGLVAQIIQQQARQRVKELKGLQESLVERWGAEVKGNVPLNEEGYPIDLDAQDAQTEGKKA